MIRSIWLVVLPRYLDTIGSRCFIDEIILNAELEKRSTGTNMVCVMKLPGNIFFHSCTVLILSSLFIHPTDSQLFCYKRMSQITLKFILKSPYIFRFSNHDQVANVRALQKL